MKTYRIIKQSVFDKKQVADVTLKANSYEKALISYGAEKPKLYYQSYGINQYLDKNNWQYLVSMEKI
jgi:hypothetical protein